MILAVDCVLAFGPDLLEALSRRDSELVVVYTPSRMDSVPEAQLRGALAMLAQLIAQPAGSAVVVSPPSAHALRASATELLSKREQEVIGLVAQAYTNGQIARRLGIAEGTVKRHVNSIFIKLDAVSRLDAVNKWLTERPDGPAGNARRTHPGRT